MRRLRVAAVMGLVQAAAMVVALHGCSLDLKPFVEPDASPYFTPDGAGPTPTIVDSGTVDASDGATPDASRPNDGGPVVPGAKRVFVTSSVFTGNLGGADGADAKCNAAAGAAKLGGTYVAWVSGLAESAANRVKLNGPWYLVDQRTRVFSDRAALKNGPEAPISLDETGKKPAITVALVWTGTTAAGAGTTPDQSCGGFTNEVGAGMAGEIATGAKWTESGLIVCTTALHLYCFEQ